MIAPRRGVPSHRCESRDDTKLATRWDVGDRANRSA
jgi:hypothetical protein